MGRSRESVRSGGWVVQMTQAQFRVVLEKFMKARARYFDTRTAVASKAWKAADLELALAYSEYMKGKK